MPGKVRIQISNEMLLGDYILHDPKKDNEQKLKKMLVICECSKSQKGE